MAQSPARLPARTTMDVYATLSHPVALTVFILTLFLPVLVGFLAVRRTRSQSDFFVGGRAMNRVVVALSAVSSGRSSWLVLGLSGVAYVRGASAAWAFVGYTAVELLQCLYLGPRLRRETERFGSITLLDYLESRFGDSEPRLRVIGSAIIGIFITAYVAAQLNAGAKTLSSALGLNLVVCLILSALLILVYMVLGGYVAVAWNDVVRAVLMLLALIVLPAYGLVRVGGLAPLREQLVGLDPTLVDPFALGLGAFIGFVGIGLGSPGQPHILVRYMSIDEPRHLRTAALIGTVWNVLLGLGAVLIGLLGRVLVPRVEALPGSDPEMIYLALSSELFGPVLYGLLVGGVFAAILSTADSQLLVVASTFARDVYEKTLRRDAKADEAARLRLGRVVLIASGGLALVLAWSAQDLVFWLVLFAWGGLGASLGPALILSLFWRGATRDGIAAGMVTGTVVTIGWRIWLRAPTGLYELVPGFALAALAIWVVSRARRSQRS
ncbi:MAG: sodium/proline symporter [Acidobacteriota bacterium]